MIKRILAGVATALLLSTSAFAAGANAVIDTVAVTSTAASTTLSTTAAGAPRAVTVRNDGAATVYVDFGRVAVADSTTALPVGPCESLTVTFNSGRPLTASSITASGSSSVRIVGAFDVAGTEPVKAADAVKYADMPACAAITASGFATVNGASFLPVVNSELLTLSTSGTTTDTTADLLPANAIIDAAVCRVTTTITTATDWGISDPTTTLRFSAVNATMTAGTTIVGLKHMFGVVSTTATGPTQAAAAKLRITTTGTPGAGAVRCSVFARVATPPAS